MKILLVSSTFTSVTHGPAKFAKLMTQLPALYDHVEIRILTKDIDLPIDNKIYTFKRNYPRGIGIFWEYWDNVLLSKKIKHIYNEYKFDIVIFNAAVLSGMSSLTLPKPILKIGMLNDNEYISNSISNISLSKEWFIKWKSRFLEKWSCNRLDLIIANSDYIKNLILTDYKIPKPKIGKLYKSINFENFKERNYQAINDHLPIRILFVKNDYVRGGLFVLIDALSIIEKYQFIIECAGMGKTDQTIISKYKKGKHVAINFLGKISQKAVSVKMHHSDIFCVPAIREGLGVANIEALASKIPVVSTSAGGIPEVLNHGNNGWQATPGNSMSLANQIIACIQEEDKRKTKVEAGFKFVKRTFNYKVMLDNIYNIILKAQSDKLMS